MAAYVIAEVNVDDPDTYATYRAGVPATLEKYAGTFRVRGGKTETVEGGWEPGRIVVIEFADVAAAKRWYNSPEYQAILPNRLNASRGKLIIVEGA